MLLSSASYGAPSRPPWRALLCFLRFARQTRRKSLCRLPSPCLLLSLSLLLPSREPRRQLIRRQPHWPRRAGLLPTAHRYELGGDAHRDLRDRYRADAETDRRVNAQELFRRYALGR